MSVSSDSPEACCFCAVGALERAGLRCNGVTEFAKAKSLLKKAIDPNAKTVYIGDWNDMQKNRLPVLAAFRRAIKLAGQSNSPGNQTRRAIKLAKSA